jgi:(2Fe-2S) ferredoxin
MSQHYKSHVFCCINERPAGHERGSCKARGADPLRNYLRTRVKELGIAETRINGAGCLDRCEEGPVMVVYPEGIWYTYKSQADVDEIISSHLQNGVPVEHLRLSKKEVK